MEISTCHVKIVSTTKQFQPPRKKIGLEDWFSTKSLIRRGIPLMLS